MSIPPIILNGQPTCPQGYGLSPDGSQCLPITPPISVDVAGVAAQEIDPTQAARLSASGIRQSGLIERFVAARGTAPITIGLAIIKGMVALFDSVMTLAAGVMESAQGQGNASFYRFAAALMQDLLGIEIDGAALADTFANQGRVAAMTSLGGALFQNLAGEFAGVAQRGRGNSFTAPKGAGLGGLPVKTYAPGDGIKAAETFLGFATSFAVREGNTDAWAELCENEYWNPFRVFKDFAEDFSKSLGIGRWARVIMRPLLQIMVALPLQYDLNTQYRPTLLGPTDALRAWKIGAFSDTDLAAELQMHGYSDARIKALTSDKSKPLSIGDYRLALAASGKTLPANFLTVDTMAARLAVDQYDLPTIQGLNIVLDHEPARKTSLTYVEHYVLQFLTGHITYDAIKQFLKQAQSASGVLLTPGEFDAFNALIDSVSVNPVLRIRHLPLATLQLAYIDGTITLNELETHLQQLGYSDADITILTLETLIKSKERAAVAAAKATKGKTGAATAGSGLSGIGGAPLA